MRVQRAVGYVLIAVVVIAMAGLFNHGRFIPRSHFEQADTTVWYCAGQAARDHADPYLVEPLRTCEIQAEPDKSRTYPWVEPAPLPGYGLAAFSLMARLPFPLARTLWFYMLIGAVFASAFMLAKMARVPLLAALLCLAIVDGTVNLFYGELPPLVLAFLIASAALGASKRFTAAALVGALAMIEPHLGLPACLAMFAWWPRTRIPLILSGAVLAAVSVAAIGLPANVEYFRAMLPIHAAAEIAAQDQYSLTRVLHILGLPDKIALAAGSVSYLCMTILGAAIARRVALVVQSEALVVLLPPAVALLGGPFVHDLQMAAAIPAALILASSARPPVWLRLAALVAIVIPWHNNGDFAGQLGGLEIAAIGAAVFIALRARPVVVRVAVAVAGVVACIAVSHGIEKLPARHVGPSTVIAPLAVGPRDISSAAWAAYVTRDRSYTTPDMRDVAEKLPVWFALIALTGMALGLARSRRLVLTGQSAAEVPSYAVARSRTAAARSFSAAWETARRPAE